MSGKRRADKSPLKFSASGPARAATFPDPIVNNDRVAQFHSMAYSTFAPGSLVTISLMTVLLAFFSGNGSSHIFKNPPIGRGSWSMMRLLIEQRAISVFGSLE